MSMVVLLILAYLVLFAGAVFCFALDRRGLGTALIAVMMLGALLLGYLWLRSPM